MSASADLPELRNFLRYSDRLTTSGKLDKEDPARLAAMGVKHVINLALDEHPEALKNEGELLAAQGIEYTHIPVPFDAPDKAHVTALSQAIEAVDGPIHVHCIMNYRVTAFLYLLDRENGVPQSVAHERMAQVWDPIASDDPRTDPWKALIRDK